MMSDGIAVWVYPKVSFLKSRDVLAHIILSTFVEF